MDANPQCTWPAQKPIVQDGFPRTRESAPRKRHGVQSHSGLSMRTATFEKSPILEMLFYQHHTYRGSSWSSHIFFVQPKSPVTMLHWTLPDKLMQARSKWRAWTASFFVAWGRLHDKQPKDMFREPLITILFPSFPLFLAKIFVYWISLDYISEPKIFHKYLLRFPIIRWRGVLFCRPLQYNLGKINW